jgi:hypothetical protein
MKSVVVFYVYLHRTDSEKIRKELIQQKDEERQKAIEEIQKHKQNDLIAERNRIKELEQQVKEIGDRS